MLSGVVIDLSDMRRVRIDRLARTARLQVVRHGAT